MIALRTHDFLTVRDIRLGTLSQNGCLFIASACSRRCVAHSLGLRSDSNNHFGLVLADIWREFAAKGPDGKPCVASRMRMYGEESWFYQPGTQVGQNNRKNAWGDR